MEVKAAKCFETVPFLFKIIVGDTQQAASPISHFRTLPISQRLIVLEQVRLIVLEQLRGVKSQLADIGWCLSTNKSAYSMTKAPNSRQSLKAEDNQKPWDN